MQIFLKFYISYKIFNFELINFIKLFLAFKFSIIFYLLFKN